MNKKLFRKIAVTVGVLLIIYLLGNIGLNIWLKNYLPKYIKNNSDYKISYATLNVDLGTGNVQASDVKISSKNPQNTNVMGLDGTVREVSINRFGIWDAITNKKISTDRLLLVKPNLKITLAKPIDSKTGKKQNPLTFSNIQIEDGNVVILRHTKQRFFAVNHLDLEVTNLKMTEEAVENKLPVLFDHYNISGTQFYFRPDNIYLLQAQKINTENGHMNIADFRLTPLLTYQQFRHFYPEKRNLFKLTTSEMEFKDMLLKKNKITLSQVRFENPDVTISTTTAKKTQKDFKYELDFLDVVMNNAKINVLKTDGSKLFSAERLDLDLDKLLMDEETAKGNIPFSYENFKIAGKQIHYSSANQNIAVANLLFNKNLVDLRNVNVNPTVSQSAKTIADFTANHIQLKLNEWNFINNKIKIDAESALINGLNGAVYAPASKAKKKPDYSGFDFPLKVKNIQVISPKFSFYKGKSGQTFNQLNLKVRDLVMDGETIKAGLPFKTGFYSFSTANYLQRVNQFYNLTAGLIKFNNNELLINNFALKPLVSRAQFIRMIPNERDLYDLKANQVSAKGNWDFVSGKDFLYASQVTVNGANANIFRSKIPADDPSIKRMYSDLLRTIRFPMTINNLDVKNSVLEYEEDTHKSEGPGKLTFGSFNMNIKNLNSGKSPGKSTKIPISINCKFMNASPMNVRWNIDTASKNDAFTIAGNISDLPANRINPFIEPYLKIRATGLISELTFDFKGTLSGIGGTMKMKHQKLKVDLIKETGEKNKLLSAVVNVFVRSNSGKFPESVVVDGVKRDPTRSFFNLFWKGIQEGLKKTLIGKNIEKTENTVRNTVSEAKAAGKEVSKTVKDAQSKIKEITASEQGTNAEQPKKDNLFRRIFKKKEKSE